MFIETYYDERARGPASPGEPAIPYPELSGEEIRVWQEYLPMKIPIENLSSRFIIEDIPGPVIAEIEKAKNAPRLFDQIEVWSRTDDPMVVGIVGGQKPRYFSIVRWGDAKLTLEQVKKRLRVEQWLRWLTLSGGIFGCLVVIFAAMMQGR
jgi:hypothetical protein